MSTATVRIVRLSSRNAEDGSGTWDEGAIHTLPVAEARALLDLKLVRLAPGETLPADPAPPPEGGAV